MTDVPEVPETFDNPAECIQYIDQLQSRLEHLANESDGSATEIRELQQNLAEIKAQVRSEEHAQIHATLEELIERLEAIELHGTPSDVGLQDSLRNPDFGSE